MIVDQSEEALEAKRLKEARDLFDCMCDAASDSLWFFGDTVELSLHNGSPEDPGTELQYPGYYRPQVPRTQQFWHEDFYPVVKSSRVCNTQTIFFAPTPLNLSPVPEVTHFGVWREGWPMMSGALARAAKLGPAEVQPRFLPGELVVELRDKDGEEMSNEPLQV